jgi:hypothetical protein
MWQSLFQQGKDVIQQFCRRQVSDELALVGMVVVVHESLSRPLITTCVPRRRWFRWESSK